MNVWTSLRWSLALLVLPLRVAMAQNQLPPDGTLPTARLIYMRGTGAELCPDEESVQRAVSSRLGYDPFRPDAQTTVKADVGQADGALRVRIELLNSAGKVVGKREFASSQNDCSELSSTMTLAISIAIDPRSGTRPVKTPPAPLPPPAPAPPPPLEKPSPPAAAVTAQAAPPCPQHRDAAPDPIELSASVGAIASFGSAPAPALGWTAQARARRRNLSFGVEGRFDLPAYENLSPTGRIGAWTALGSLVPCMHRSVVGACALVSLGVLRGTTEQVEVPRADATFLAAAGARLGVEVPLSEIVSIGVHADLEAVLTRTTLVLDSRAAWASPPAMAAVGAAAIAHF